MVKADPELLQHLGLLGSEVAESTFSRENGVDVSHFFLEGVEARVLVGGG